MLRELFYGKQTPKLAAQALNWSDAQPREVFITACLLIPIIGIGVYPKLVTQTYDVKTTEVAAHEHQILAQNSSDTTNLYASVEQNLPQIPPVETISSISIKELDKIIAPNFS